MLDAGHDHAGALKLYEWNSRLSASFLHDFAHVEVYLRNICDRALQGALAPGDSHWTDKTTRDLLFPTKDLSISQRRRNANKETKEKINSAVKRCGRSSNRRVEPGKVVAELTFGFWVQLFSAGNEAVLWKKYLHPAFKPGTDRARLHSMLEELQRFRNRVAHHEPVRVQAEGARRQMQGLCKLMSLELGAYVDKQSSIDDLIKGRPIIRTDHSARNRSAP